MTRSTTHYFVLVFSFLFAVFLFAGCSNPSADDANGSETSWISTESEDQLQGKLQLTGAPLNWEGTYSMKQAGKPDKKPVVEYEEVGYVESPVTTEGDTLSATWVTTIGNYVYASYHLSGEDFAGAVEVYRIQNNADPRLISKAFFEDTDINAILPGGPGLLYITGGRKSGKATGLETPAFVAALRLVANRQFDNPPLRSLVDLPSFSGNSLFFDPRLSSADGFSTKLWIASGATGGGVFSVDALNPAEIIDSIPLSPVKHLTGDGQFTTDNDGAITGLISHSRLIGITSGENAALHVFANAIEEPGTPVAYPIEAIIPANGKVVPALKDETIWIPLLENGLGAWSIDNGTPETVLGPEYFGNDNTASVVIQGNHLMVASGGAGLYLADIQDSDDITTWKLQDFAGSANHLTVSGNTIVVAAGKAGVRIFRRN